MECSTVQLSNLSPEYHESHPTLNTIVTPDIFEAHRRVLVNAVRKHQRVFQVGSQQRSMALNQIACQAVRSGALGKLIEVQAPCYPGSCPSTTDVGAEEPTPAGLDWNMWLNQVAWRPFNGKWGGGVGSAATPASDFPGDGRSGGCAGAG